MLVVVEVVSMYSAADFTRTREKGVKEKIPPPAPFSWRERRRSRVAEITDGAFMLLSDVAVIRTLVVVMIMFVVAFLSRKHSSLGSALTIAACFYLLCELFNTVVETIVDRISMEANVLSARIKHAAAFISALAGGTSFVLLLIVLYQVFMSPRTEESHHTPALPPHAHYTHSTIPPAAAAISPVGRSPEVSHSSAPSAPATVASAPSAPAAVASASAQPASLELPKPSTIVHPLLWNHRVNRKRYTRYNAFKFRNKLARNMSTTTTTTTPNSAADPVNFYRSDVSSRRL